MTPEDAVESAARQNNRALITIPRVPVPWCEERDINHCISRKDPTSFHGGISEDCSSDIYVQTAGQR